MVAAPEQYRWSSAAAHLGGPEAESFRLLDWNDWANRGGSATWHGLLAKPEDTREWREVRRATYAGAPLGTPEFQQELEERLGRRWRPRGRPPKREARGEDGSQLCTPLSIA